VSKFAPKIKQLCEAVAQTPLDLHMKHFVYSCYQSTITHLGATFDALRKDGAHVFQQVKAEDFEWCGKQVALKPSSKAAKLNADSCTIVFVILKGNAEEKKLLRAAFGFVTPDGERFEGLQRSTAMPLVQVILGARESNQDNASLPPTHSHHGAESKGLGAGASDHRAWNQKGHA
jgi:hypothetical protein